MIKKACPKKGWPLLTYEKHLVTKIGEILVSPIIILI
jgi:hypothetical protein